MARYYEIKQVNAIGNGFATTYALVINPTFDGMGIRATKVGEWDRRTIYDDTGILVHKYLPIDPVDFMIIGNATCEEKKNPFSDD